MKASAETFNECVFLENLYKYVNIYVNREGICKYVYVYTYVIQCALPVITASRISYDLGTITAYRLDLIESSKVKDAWNKDLMNINQLMTFD